MAQSKYSKLNIWQAIIKLDRLVFTTREVAELTQSSISSTTQGLIRLEQKKILTKVQTGIWALTSDKRFSLFDIIPFLGQTHQCYLSFISALHLYGIITQIPQIITVASTAHSKKINTRVGEYLIHQLEPSFFVGFDWHESGNFLIATPEKALVDCLYISSRKKNKYSSFPELEFPNNFNKIGANKWVDYIRDDRLRKSVLDKLGKIFNSEYAK